jgi:outer membrane protein OmpA-like peptidoglycan-associated protein
MKLTIIAIASILFIASGARAESNTVNGPNGNIDDRCDYTQPGSACVNVGVGASSTGISGSVAGGAGGNGGESSATGIGFGGGAVTGASTSGASSTGGGASLIGGDTKNVAVSLPEPVRVAPLPALHCPSRSRSFAVGWNFLSLGDSETDHNGICAAKAMSEMMWARCQYLTAHQIVNAALESQFPTMRGQLAMPDGVTNAAGGMCPAPIIAPVPAPVVAQKAPQRVSLAAGAMFAFNKSALTDAGRQELAAVAAKIAAAKPERLVIAGHTDGKGSNAYNDALSRARAESVRAYLALHGVSAPMTVEGRGKREPVADNMTETGRAQNRRVTVDFLGLEN